MWTAVNITLRSLSHHVRNGNLGKVCEIQTLLPSGCIKQLVLALYCLENMNSLIFGSKQR